jgi:hypothetical protein
MTDQNYVLCPRCKGSLVAKVKQYAELRYRFIGDEDGPLLEAVDTEFCEIQCGSCHREWDSHDSLKQEIERSQK